ncbi:SMC-Scp complex subunit ScpB [Patescibacteria group bacterium]
MKDLQNKIEAVLFLEAKPVSFKKLSKACGVSVAEIEDAVKALQAEYEEHEAAVTVMREGSNVQLMTAPAQAEFIKEYIATEDTGEMTRPALETLTIIAYRGPVAKSEIELIRGINCSLILRNLQIRGLVEEVGETDAGSPLYRVTLDFLRYLGVNKVSDLPDYEELNKNVHLQELLEARENKEDFFSRKEDDRMVEEADAEELKQAAEGSGAVEVEESGNEEDVEGEDEE